MSNVTLKVRYEYKDMNNINNRMGALRTVKKTFQNDKSYKNIIAFLILNRKVRNLDYFIFTIKNVWYLQYTYQYVHTCMPAEINILPKFNLHYYSRGTPINSLLPQVNIILLHLLYCNAGIAPPLWMPLWRWLL